MNTRTDYYDVEIELDDMSLKGCSLSEAFYLKDLKQRKIFINENICQATIWDAVRNIMQINREDAGIPVEERTPIKLYIVSNGGEVDSGFELIDAITTSKTPVYTVNLGYHYSMGFLIGIAGHKRFAMPNAKYLMHDGQNMVYNSTAKVQDQMRFQERMEEKTRAFVLAKTNITPEQYDDQYRREWYLFAEDAKELGVTDYIIGVDCDLEEII